MSHIESMATSGFSRACSLSWLDIMASTAKPSLTQWVVVANSVTDFFHALDHPYNKSGIPLHNFLVTWNHLIMQLLLF